MLSVIHTNMFELYLVTWILVHGPDNRPILINPAEVTSMHAKMKTDHEGLLREGVGCMVNMADGKFVSAKESCESIRKAMEEMPK